MSGEYYVPGTEEKDPAKIIMSLQQAHEKTATNATDIATNTSAITALQNGPLTSGNVATQADQETATSTTFAVTPGRQKYHPAHPKAWAYVTQSGGTYTLAASHGVSGISKAATGRVDVTLSTAFSSTAFAAVASSSESGAFACEVLGSRTATNCRINTKLPTTNADVDAGFAVSFYGDQ